MRVLTRSEVRWVMFDARSSPSPHPAGFDLSVHAREVTKERISFPRNARPYSPAGELLHGNELAFKQRIKFFPLGNVVGRVPDQHQCRKFMGAEHACLLIARVGAVWIASAEALAFDGALPVTHSLQMARGVDGRGSAGGRQSGSSRILGRLGRAALRQMRQPAIRYTSSFVRGPCPMKRRGQPFGRGGSVGHRCEISRRVWCRERRDAASTATCHKALSG